MTRVASEKASIFMLILGVNGELSYVSGIVRRKGIAPLILNRDIRWEWSGSRPGRFTPGTH
jgi:hypothetical protein